MAISFGVTVLILSIIHLSDWRVSGGPGEGAEARE
jgi:hypothetical protein